MADPDARVLFETIFEERHDPGIDRTDRAGQQEEALSGQARPGEEKQKEEDGWENGFFHDSAPFRMNGVQNPACTLEIVPSQLCHALLEGRTLQHFEESLDAPGEEGGLPENHVEALRGQGDIRKPEKLRDRGGGDPRFRRPAQHGQADVHVGEDHPVIAGQCFRRRTGLADPVVQKYARSRPGLAIDDPRRIRNRSSNPRSPRGFPFAVTRPSSG
jgi:hypothetical protein